MTKAGGAEVDPGKAGPGPPHAVSSDSGAVTTRSDVGGITQDVGAVKRVNPYRGGEKPSRGSESRNEKRRVNVYREDLAKSKAGPPGARPEFTPTLGDNDQRKASEGRGRFTRPSSDVERRRLVVGDVRADGRETGTHRAGDDLAGHARGSFTVPADVVLDHPPVDVVDRTVDQVPIEHDPQRRRGCEERRTDRCGRLTRLQES